MLLSNKKGEIWKRFRAWLSCKLAPEPPLPPEWTGWQRWAYHVPPPDLLIEAKYADWGPDHSTIVRAYYMRPERGVYDLYWRAMAHMDVPRPPEISPERWASMSFDQRRNYYDTF